MNSVLVDTSVWVSHFKSANAQLVNLLSNDLVLTHPFVLGEIACGTPPKRIQLLQSLRELESTNVATPDEILRFIDQHVLYGKGRGLVDVSLLASVKITAGAVLWTMDQRLATLAKQCGVEYTATLPVH